MKKDDVLNILTAMKKSYLSLGIPDPEAVEALEIAIKAIQTDNSEKVYQKAFEDIRAEIQTKYDSIPWRNNQYDDGWIEGLEWVLEEVIDKHNPDKVENEGKE